MCLLIFIVVCLLVFFLFVMVVWECIYNGEIFYVSMLCENVIKWGIMLFFKEWLDVFECVIFKCQKDVLWVELEDVVLLFGKVFDEEVVWLDWSVVDLGMEQYLYGCKDVFLVLQVLIVCFWL